jgi:cation transport regulator ChaB
MPYDTIVKLPDRVKDNLPKDTQKIFKETNNMRGINMQIMKKR